MTKEETLELLDNLLKKMESEKPEELFKHLYENSESFRESMAEEYGYTIDDFRAEYSDREKIVFNEE